MYTSPGRTIHVAALVPYHPEFCAGQRFRVELWAKHLAARGIRVELLPFTDDRFTRALYTKGNLVRKAAELARVYALHAARLVRAARPDVVYVYREAAVAGPELFEQIAKVWGAPVVYDLDEPLFQPYVSQTNGRLTALKFPGKYDRLTATAARVWCCNEALAEHCRPFNPNISIVPMAVDTERYSPSAAGSPGVPGEPLRLGWMGTRTSQVNLGPLEAPLRRLSAERPVRLRVLADEPMAIEGVDVEFLPWRFDQEVPLLRECAIGVVPVLPDPWSHWKFYFKLIQFMALGIPVVASAEGSNREIVVDGENGLLVRHPDEWYERLRLLADNPELRRTLAVKAREAVLARFSLAKQLDFVESTFRELA
ncbi:MAG: glycosyltransferase [Myxococcales bacterium]|nr:glycosyltransferase [Myxococcales bacterium]